MTTHHMRGATTAEKQIATKLVDHFLALGYRISVFDGEETTVSRSADREHILGSLASTDEDHLTLRHTDHGHIGSVTLIWGNDTDLISDNTDVDWLNSALRPVEELAEHLAAGATA